MEELSNKVPSSLLTADDWNQLCKEMENIITSQGITLSNLVLSQGAISVSKYSTDGDFYTAGGVADAITLTAVAPQEPVTAYTVGMRVRFIATNDNVGATPTVNVEGLGAITIELYPTFGLDAGDITTGQTYQLIYTGSVFIIIRDQFDIVGPIQGSKEFWPILSFNSVTSLDFEIGNVLDDTKTITIEVSGAITKLLSVVWDEATGGLASAAFPSQNDTTYFAFILSKLDGTENAGYDTVASGANLVSDSTGDGYVFKRCIGAFYTDPSGDIINFRQVGDQYFLYDLQNTITSFPGATPGNSVLKMPLHGFEPMEVRALVAVTSTLFGQEKTMATFLNPSDTAPTFATISDNLQPFTDIYGHEVIGNAGAGNVQRLVLYPNSSNQIRIYPRSDPNGLGAMQQEISVVSYVIDRLKLTS